MKKYIGLLAVTSMASMSAVQAAGDIETERALST
jgi:orotidine-5'-phosphate decarboxylase